MEPGEPVIPLKPGLYSLEAARDGVLLESWADGRVLRRRLKAVRKSSRRRLDLDIERFPRKRGTLCFVDLDAPGAAGFETESSRGVARERFRRWCERLHPEWRFECLSSAADLEHSLSPRFPRCLLRRGSEAICAIAAPQAEEAGDLFTFGLVWLQHCRLRWPDLHVQTLLLLAPEEAASAIALRLVACNHARVRYRLVAWSADESLRELAPRSWGNLGTHFSVGGGSPANAQARGLFEEVASQCEAECVEDLHGVLSLELHGLPLARAEGGEMRCGLKLRRAEPWPPAERLLRLAQRVAMLRHPQSRNPQHVLYRMYPERWLESVVRRQIRAIDPTLSPAAVRRQVSGALGTHHTRTDLLALDETGRLVVIEVKAGADIHLPAQALDYYARLKLHLERGDLRTQGLFPGRGVSALPPRLLLVAPALCFHPANETVLDFLESSIQVRQIGIALEWRKELRVVFQHPLGSARQGGSVLCPVISSSRSVKRLRR